MRKRTPTYISWASMKQRCDNPHAANYKYYGGKGIGYDPRWEKFSAFLADMGERPEGTELDRARSEEDYSKSNCRWVTKTQQLRNRPYVKLSEELAYEIRLLSDRYTQRDLAAMYSVTASTVSHLLRGRSWT